MGNGTKLTGIGLGVVRTTPSPRLFRMAPLTGPWTECDAAWQPVRRSGAIGAFQGSLEGVVSCFVAENDQNGERSLQGIPVSGGICQGKLLVLRANDTPGVLEYEVAPTEVAAHVHRFEEAILKTRCQLEEIQKQVSHQLGEKEASIFEAHVMFLEDPTLIAEVTRRIGEENLNVERAVEQAVQALAAAFEGLPEKYFQERATDVRDVGRRLLNNLTGQHEELDLSHLKEPAIIISQDLKPSQTALLDRQVVLGFATEIGGPTCHTAIMANSLRIPAVVGMPALTRELHTGQHALLDGFNGRLILNPTDQTLYEYGEILRRHVSLEERLNELRGEPAVTLDGCGITLSANVEKAEDAPAVTACGADGVGLFRTEYVYLNRDRIPSEQEQYESYHAAAAALRPHPVIIRTLDLGGDKPMAHLRLPQEINPFLGYRAIRYCLQEQDVFRTQLRAILRASTEGNVKLMYPMISSLEELKDANRVLDQARAQLRDEHIPFDPNLEVGVMVEVPSAAIAADILAKHVKFFSIGTNDLIQYTLAVDRQNERIAHLYQPANPAILRLIKMTADAGRTHGIWTGVCGQIAGDKYLTPLLLGLGIRELSTAPPNVPGIKYLIRRLKMSECIELAEWALHSDSPKSVMDRCQELVRRIAPSLFDA